jgi:hypothetical protein
MPQFVTNIPTTTTKQPKHLYIPVPENNSFYNLIS